MTNTETPEQHLKNYELTLKLRSLGVTPEQLQAMQFWKITEGLPFDQWPVTWDERTTSKAFDLIRPYCALKWLILQDPPSSRDRDDAWRLVSDTLNAPIFAIGIRTKVAQSKRARLPRGKIGDEGKPLHQVIADLVLGPEHRDESTKELWPHFYSKLEQYQLAPEEIKHPSDFRRSKYEYDFKGSERKTISYGQFSNVVSKIRGEKNQLSRAK